MSPCLPPLLAERFRVRRQLGAGAFGEVVEAVPTGAEDPVAIKLLRPEFYAQEETRRRFLREAEVAAGLLSPHVARALEWGVDGGRPYIVFDLIPGGSLEEVRRQAGGHLPLEAALELTRQVLAALSVAHRAGVVHRDLKPANVLVDPEGQAVVTDFGLARRVDEETMTRTGQVMGTLATMPPEQMEGGEPRPDWDVYAAAVMLWELSTGALPFDGESVAALYDAKRAGHPGRLVLPEGTAPPALEALLAAALSPDPAARPRDGTDFLLRLLEVTEDETGSASMDSTLSLVMDAMPRTAVLPQSAREAATTVTLGPPRGGGARRPRGALVVALAGLAGLATWVLAPSEAPGGPAPPQPDEELPEARDRARVDLLARLDRALDEDPVVRRLFEAGESRVLAGRTEENWHAARAVYRRQLREVELHRRLREDAGRPPGEGELEVLGRLVQRQWLLTHPDRGQEPLFPDRGPPGLAARLAALVQAVPEPLLTGRPGAAPGRNFRELQHQVEIGGRRWENLRPLARVVAHTVEQGRARIRIRDRIRPLHPNGDPWVDPMGGAEGVLADSLSSYSRTEDEFAVTMVPLEPHPFLGDLVLSLVAYDWHPAVLMQVALVGRERSLRLPVEVPPPLVPDREQGALPFQGVTLRVPRARVPRGLRRVEVRAVGFHDLCAPRPTLSLGEVYQLIDGPLPASLGGPTP